MPVWQNAQLITCYGGDRLMVRGACVAEVAGMVLAAAWTDWGKPAGLVVPAFVHMAATGFIVANAVAGALNGFPDRAGAVAALVGAIHYGSGILEAVRTSVSRGGLRCRALVLL